MQELTDIALLLRLKEDDELAFRQLFDRYRNKVYSFAMYLTRSEPLAEDITQDVFCRIWAGRHQLEEVDYFNSWLRVIARNIAYNHLKRIAHEKLILMEMAGQAPDAERSPEMSVALKEYGQLIQQAIDQLPGQQRMVYILSRQEGLKYGEIAERMHLSHNTVKTHMKQALRAVRAYLDGRLDVAILLALALFFHD